MTTPVRNRLLLSVAVGALILTNILAPTAIPVAYAALQIFLITPTAFDFGDVPVGSTSPNQTVTMINLSNNPIVMNGVGGGAGVFGGVVDCQGVTLQPKKFCHMFYAFTPTRIGPVTGSTSGNWNGQSFSFKGNGV